MNETDFNYELFFDLSPDLVCIAGFDGYFKKVNPAVSNLLGYSKEELYSKPINYFVFEEDKLLTSTARDNLNKSIPLTNFENRYVTKSGEIVWLAWTSQPIKNDQLVFAIAKNITHKKRVEIETQTLLKSISEVNRDLKQFNLVTSHDLRSPLSSLMTFFELLDSSKIEDQETLELIEILKLTVEKLKDTLNNYVDVLSGQESEHGSEQKNLEEVDAEDCLNNVLESIPSLITISGAVITTDFSEADKINFNKVCLESVFLNLITNAIKYARPGHAPEISIRLVKDANKKQLIVADNGSGFDMDNVKDKIFGLNQTFHQNQDSRGVGLYLVHEHITRFGGEITVESEVNKGSRFIMTFID